MSSAAISIKDRMHKPTINGLIIHFIKMISKYEMATEKSMQYAIVRLGNKYLNHTHSHQC